VKLQGIVAEVFQVVLLSVKTSGVTDYAPAPISRLKPVGTSGE
jgi:hypothetical protein